MYYLVSHFRKINITTDTFLSISLTKHYGREFRGMNLAVQRIADSFYEQNKCTASNITNLTRQAEVIQYIHCGLYSFKKHVLIMQYNAISPDNTKLR